MLNVSQPVINQLFGNKAHACSFGKQWSHIVWFHFTGVLNAGVYKKKVQNNIMLLILSDCLSCTLILNDQKIAQHLENTVHSCINATVDRLKTNTIHVNSTPNSHFL